MESNYNNQSDQSPSRTKSIRSLLKESIKKIKTSSNYEETSRKLLPIIEKPSFLEKSSSIIEPVVPK